MENSSVLKVWAIWRRTDSHSPQLFFFEKHPTFSVHVHTKRFWTNSHYKLQFVDYDNMSVCMGGTVYPADWGQRQKIATPLPPSAPSSPVHGASDAEARDAAYLMMRNTREWAFFPQGRMSEISCDAFVEGLLIQREINIGETPCINKICYSGRQKKKGTYNIANKAVREYLSLRKGLITASTTSTKHVGGCPQLSAKRRQAATKTWASIFFIALMAACTSISTSSPVLDDTTVHRLSLACGTNNDAFSADEKRATLWQHKTKILRWKVDGITCIFSLLMTCRDKDITTWIQAFFTKSFTYSNS